MKTPNYEQTLKHDPDYLTNNNKQLIEWKRYITREYDVYLVSLAEYPEQQEIYKIYVNKQTRQIEAQKKPDSIWEQGNFGQFNSDDYGFLQTVANPFPELSLYP